MLQTDIRHDLVQTYYQRVSDTEAGALETTFREMEGKGVGLLREEKVEAGEMRFVRTADMRYVGQEYFVSIGLPAVMDVPTLGELPGRFHAAYLERYGHSNPEESIEFVNLRVSAIGVLPRAQSAASHSQAEGGEAVPVRREKVYFGGEWLDAGFYMRDQLQSGQVVNGPAIVLEASCTTVMPPRCRASVDPFGNIEILLDD